MKSIKYLLPLVALAASGIASAATRDAPGVVVRFGDLDLNSQTGVASLHKRIRNAAESVCGPLETRILGLRDAYDVCVERSGEQRRRRGRQPEPLEFPREQRKGRDRRVELKRKRCLAPIRLQRRARRINSRARAGSAL